MLDPTEHIKLWLRDKDDVDWSGIAMEPTETWWIQDREPYLDNEPIYKQTTDGGIDYIIQPKGMLKWGSMCSTELMSKKEKVWIILALKRW